MKKTKETGTQRNYKDTIFRMIFREKENLLSLYNALNGTDSQPEQQILYLSDAFEKRQDEPSLELAVTVYNINLGHNQRLLGACRLLKEYAQYVEQVRTYIQQMPLSEAVEKAVDDCIKNGILADFLAKNRAEAIAVSIFEYDEEKHMKSERKEWREIGRKEGITEGMGIGREAGLAEGVDNLARLLKSLMDAGKTEEANRVICDSDYREKLLQNYFQEGKCTV